MQELVEHSVVANQHAERANAQRKACGQEHQQGVHVLATSDGMAAAVGTAQINAIACA